MRGEIEIRQQLDALADRDSNDDEIAQLREIVDELLRDRSDLLWPKGNGVYS